MTTARATIENQNMIELTISMTMRVDQWKELRAQLPSQYPSWKVASLITQVLDKALGQVSDVHEGEV